MIKKDNDVIRISEYLQDEEPKYIDVLLGDTGDEKRFIDIYTILHRNSKDEAYEFKERIINKVRTYFGEILSAIGTTDEEKKLRYLAKYVHEARFTKLGFSIGGSGKGLGYTKFCELITSIKNSEAYNSKKINDILDAELYVKNVGVDIISDLITNLIQDILGEYTEKKLNQLAMADKLRYRKMHYWNEKTRQWAQKEIATVSYSLGIGEKEYNYLLVPTCFTANEDQKQFILGQIFREHVYNKFKNIILTNEEEYSNYIAYYKRDKKVHKKDVALFINNNYGDGLAKVGDGYLTSKGLLDLVERFNDIREFIEEKIKGKSLILE